MGKDLEGISTEQNFLNRTPVTQALRSTVDKGDLLKMKSFSKAKDTDTRTKQQATNWEKIFTNPTTNKGVISKLYKEYKLDAKKKLKMGYRAK